MRLAARGTRNMDNGDSTVEDDMLKARLRSQAAKVYVESILAAVVVTALFLLIPVF